MSVSMKHMMSPVGQRYLSATQKALASSIGRLSPLQKQHAEARNNTSEKVALENSTSVLSRAASDAISFTQVADDALQTIQELISSTHKMLQGTDLVESSVSSEMQQLRAAIDKISNQTEYAGRHILNGSTAGINSLSVELFGANNQQESFQFEILTTNSVTLGLDFVRQENDTNNFSAVEILSSALDTVGQRRSALASIQHKLQEALTTSVETQDSVDLIRDVGSAEETLALVRKQILSQASASMMSQAKQLPQVALSLIGS